MKGSRHSVLSNPGNWTVVQLRGLAERVGLDGYSRMDKTGLLEAVSEVLPQSTPSVIALEHAAALCLSAPAASSGASELPSHITILPRDPQWAYVFWEISAAINSAPPTLIPPNLL